MTADRNSVSRREYWEFWREETRRPMVKRFWEEGRMWVLDRTERGRKKEREGEREREKERGGGNITIHTKTNR